MDKTSHPPEADRVNKEGITHAGVGEHDEQMRVIDLVPKFDKYWWRIPYLLSLNIRLSVPLVTGYLIGFDSSMLNGIQSVPVWIETFNHPSGSRLGVLGTMQTIGAVSSLPIAPFLTDRLGRRHPIAIGSILCLLGTALQSAAPNTAMFIGGRFFVGFGAGIVGNASSPLLAELSYPTHRPFITSFANTSWYLGAIVAAWSTYGTFQMDSNWSWRIPSILQAIPSLYQLLFIYFLPESPRWLIGKGRRREAKEILDRYHAGSDESSILTEFELAEMETAIELEIAQNKRSYLDFFSTPRCKKLIKYAEGNRWRFALVFILGIMGQWAGNGLVSFYLIIILNNIGITNAKTQNLINGGLQIFNYATSIAGAFCVPRFRRRTILLVACAGMFVAYLIWTVLSSVNQQRNFEDGRLGIAIVVMIFIFYMCFNLGFASVPPTYVMEILPFTLRAKGFMINQLTTYGSGLFNGFVNPIAMENIGWRYYIVFVVLLAVWFAVIYFLFPETSRRTLEEVSEIFDGPAVGHGTIDRIKTQGGAAAETIEKV